MGFFEISSNLLEIFISFFDIELKLNMDSIYIL